MFSASVDMDTAGRWIHMWCRADDNLFCLFVCFDLIKAVDYLPVNWLIRN